MRARAIAAALFAALVAAFCAAPAAAQQQDSADAQGRVAATIVPALSVRKSQDLVLGEFRPGDAPGSVELDVFRSSPAPTRTSSGGVALAGSSFSAAEFSINTHVSGAVHFDVVLPPVITLQRVGGSEVMRVDAFRSQLKQDCAGGSPSCEGVPYTLLVGATVHVESGQKAGQYVGTFTVTVNQL